MTDKQIIIDGVDVSGCECYSEHREGYCGWHIPCEGDICLYKLKWALQQLKRKEQECEILKKKLDIALRNNTNITHLKLDKVDLQSELEQLKAEVKSKTEYIQEQRDIINQYSKEIEMYKKCQGKRASKREEELKAENEELKKIIKRLDVPKHEVVDMDIALENEKLKEENKKLKEEKQGLIKDWEEKKNLGYEIACKNEKLKEEIKELKKVSCKFKDYCSCDTEKLRQTLKEIKEIAKFNWGDKNMGFMCNQILEKISEVEDANI